MRRIFIPLLALILPACWGKGASQVERFEEAYLPYRQPNDDPNVPELMAVRVNPDGSHQLVHVEATLPADFEDASMWGKRYRIRVETVYNPTWTTTVRIVEEIVEQTVDIAQPFELRGVSAGYFRGDRRTLIDGKSLVCESDEVCAALDAAIDAGGAFDLAMRFGPSAEAPLVVTAPAPVPRTGG